MYTYAHVNWDFLFCCLNFNSGKFSFSVLWSFWKIGISPCHSFSQIFEAMGKSYPPLPSLIFILSLAIIIICTFAALIYIPSPPPHSYAMCPKYWSPLRTVQKRKKNKKKQGNKHFPPHSSCSYVMCPEYCDCLVNSVYRYFTFFYIPTSCWSSQSQYLHLDAKVKKKQDLDEMLETEVTTSFIQQNHQFTFKDFKDKRSI